MAEDRQLSWDRGAGHPMQSWAWGKFRKKMGNKVSRIIGDSQYQIMWSKLYFLPLWFGYIPMGPMPTEADIKLIADEARNMGAIGVRMEPNEIPNNCSHGEQLPITNDLKPGRRLFKKQTYWIDLSKSEEDLLAAMHPKARYNIKIAQKHGVTVKEDNSEQTKEKFLELMFEDTAKRQGFYAHNKNYFRQMWTELEPAGVETLFTASNNNKIVSVWIVYKWKDFIYYVYGANSLEHREVMAPTAVMWELIRWGKINGYKYLDLWGTEEGMGFGRFKEQFGGKLIESAGTYDLPVNKAAYWVFRNAEEVRWKILRAIK